MLKVLVACEESQRVCTEFRKLGHEAYSADIQEPSGEHFEWHIHGDVLKVLNPFNHVGYSSKPGRYISFRTMDDKYHEVKQWDLIIAHPPCTHLAVSGSRWFTEGKKPRYLQDDAVLFFMKFINAECKHIAVENPVCIMSTRYRKPDQIINPYQFGHTARKKTCLWLKGLPLLVPTKIVEPEIKEYVCKNGKIARFSSDYGGGDKNASSRRSKTYKGIAQAMAVQWSEYIESEVL